MTRNRNIQDLLCFKGIMNDTQVMLYNLYKKDSEFDFKVLFSVYI